jgi:hypothetical protein
MLRSATIATVIIVSLACSRQARVAATQEDAESSKRRGAAIEYDLQRKCSADAKTFFDYLETDVERRAHDEFFNHFNVRLNKCFVVVTHGINSVEDVYSKSLYDAVERREFGHYWWRAQSGRKFWDVPPLECKMLDRACATEEEFDHWLKTYTGDEAGE